VREAEIVEVVTSAFGDRNDMVDLHAAPVQMGHDFSEKSLTANLAVAAVSAK
jgi:hypothetical protein